MVQESSGPIYILPYAAWETSVSREKESPSPKLDYLQSTVGPTQVNVFVSSPPHPYSVVACWYFLKFLSCKLFKGLVDLRVLGMCNNVKPQASLTNSYTRPPQMLLIPLTRTLSRQPHGRYPKEPLCALIGDASNQGPLFNRENGLDEPCLCAYACVARDNRIITKTQRKSCYSGIILHDFFNLYEAQFRNVYSEIYVTNCAHFEVT